MRANETVRVTRRHADTSVPPEGFEMVRVRAWAESPLLYAQLGSMRLAVLINASALGAATNGNTKSLALFSGNDGRIAIEVYVLVPDTTDFAVHGILRRSDPDWEFA